MRVENVPIKMLKEEQMRKLVVGLALMLAVFTFLGALSYSDKTDVTSNTKTVSVLMPQG